MGKGHPISAKTRAAMIKTRREQFARMTSEERKAYAARLNTPEIKAGRHEQMLRRWAKCKGEDRARACAHITNPEAQAKSHAAQRTPEFLARKSAWAKAAWARLSDAEKEARAELRREQWRKLSDEEKMARRELRREQWRKLSDEEKEARAELRREQWRKLSDEERAELSAKRSSEWVDRAASECVALTDEEIAEAIAEKRKAVGVFLCEARRKKRIERGLPPVAEKRKHVSSEEFRKIQLSNLRKGHEAMKARKAARLQHEAELRKQGFPPQQKRAQRHVEGKSTDRTTLTYNGRTLTLAEWAAVTGFPKYLLSNRLAMKWPVERILTEPRKCKPRRLLTFRGETHNCNEWARILGIRQATIVARLKAGHPVEVVLSKGRKNRNTR